MKIKLVVLTILPMIVGLAVPVLAQTSSDNVAQKQTSGTVQLAKKNSCGGGACKSGEGTKGPQRTSFAGKRMSFRHHRSLIGMLRGQYALTDAQAEKLIALKAQFRDQAKPKFTDLISAKRKLSDLMTEPNVDKAQVLSLQTEINGDKDALGNLMLENKLQQLSLLTDQQRQEIRHEFLQKSARSARG